MFVSVRIGYWQLSFPPGFGSLQADGKTTVSLVPPLFSLGKNLLPTMSGLFFLGKNQLTAVSGLFFLGKNQLTAVSGLFFLGKNLLPAVSGLFSLGKIQLPAVQGLFSLEKTCSSPCRVFLPLDKNWGREVEATFSVMKQAGLPREYGGSTVAACRDPKQN